MYQNYTVYNILELIEQQGFETKPRDQKILEYVYFQGTISNPWSDYRARAYPLDYYKREMQWYLHGDPKDRRILDHAKMWEKLVQSDGSIYSNYGYYWFGAQKGFRWCYRTLLKDPDSRQAYIPMNAAKHMVDGNPDMVCTKGIQFRIINNMLHIHVSMRSSDAIFGLATDLPCFWTLWVMLGKALSVELGNFYFSADSVHIYERHFEMVQDILQNGPDDRDHVVTPAIDDIEDLMYERYESDFGKWLLEAEL